MIDTDKYEGHDLARGRVGSDYNIYDRKGNIIFDADDVGSNMATLNLLADAPLLLEEVKRLRDELHATHTWVEYTLLRLKNGAITKDELIESLWNMCNDPAHKAIVGVTE